MLANKWLEKTISSEEYLEINLWYNESLDAPIKIPSDFAESEEALRQRILNAVQKHTNSKPTIKLWPRIVAAASIVICMGIGYYFYTNTDSSSTEIMVKNDIGPGGNKAILTLADGSRITLTDSKNGDLAVQSEIKITKTNDGQLIYTIYGLPKNNNKATIAYNTIETPMGGTYQLRLPDGTKIWLNAASIIKYPVSFASQKERRITLLNGEAYFEVAKDKKHPFIVQSDQQEVEVLGTHFNISSYDDESSVKTTLIEGSVKVYNKLESVILRPNQQASLSKNGIVISSDLSTDDVIAWKNGLFSFDDEPIESVMNKIARWYNVDIDFQSKNSNQVFTGTVSRFENVSKVLEKLELTGVVHFKIKGRRIIVMQ